EHYRAGKSYWWNNAERAEDGLAVVQLITAGSIILRDPRGDHRVDRGEIIVFFHGDETEYGQPEPLPYPMSCRWVGLRGAGLIEHLRTLVRRHGPILKCGIEHPLADELERVMVLADPQRPAAPTRVSVVIYQFVMNLYDLAEQRLLQQLTPVEQAIQAILRHPHQPWSLKEVSAQYGVSREHFSRMFQKHIGQTAHQFLADAKQHRALALLRQTRLPLAEIARQAGYTSAHSLARHVRELTGLSPTIYRQQKAGH
ncbi:MAG: AraC family transcriptional regulator, partial [Planctomycetota bacterium]